jgi:CHASE2 domain-containing sensor protein
MTPTFQVPRSLKPFIGALFGVGSVLVTMLLFETSFLHETLGTDMAQGLELKGYDALVRSRGQQVQKTDVMLVRIDENTLKKMGYPIPHSQLGAVMGALSNLDRKSVV